MAIGVGLDTIHASSPALATSSSASPTTSSSKRCLGSKWIPSNTSVQRNHALQSSHASYLNRSFLHFSSLSSSATNAENYNYSSLAPSSSCRSGGRIWTLTFSEKGGQPHVKRNFLIVSQLNCSSCSNARLLGLQQQQQRRDGSRTSNVRNRGCILSSGFSFDENGVRGRSILPGVASVGCSKRGHSGSRQSTTAKCQAEGGAGNGVSLNERTSTVDSGGGPAGDSTGDGVDSYGIKPESGIPEPVASGGDTAVQTNASSGEEGEEKPVRSGSLAEVLQQARDEVGEESALEVLREILRVAQGDLESCRKNSERLEENAQKIAEKAIALKDESKEAETVTNAAISRVEELLLEEARVTEELQKATASKAVAEELVEMAEAALERALSKAKAEGDAGVELAEADGDLVEQQQGTQTEAGEKQVEAKVEVTTERTVDITVTPINGSDPSAQPELVGEQETTVAKTEVIVEGSTAEEAVARAAALLKETEALESARTFLRDSEAFSERIQAELVRVQSEKVEYELEVERLGSAADKAKDVALAADDDVAVAMAEAERAVAQELEAAQRVGDAEFALQKAVSFAADAAQQAVSFAAMEAEKLALSVGRTVEQIEEELEQRSGEAEAEKSKEEGDEKVQGDEDDGVKVNGVLETVQEEDVKSPLPSPEVAAALAEKSAKEIEAESKKAEQVAEPPVLKASKKRSSRYFPASYFSSEDGEEFSPGKAYARFVTTIKPQLAKVVIGVALLFAGGAYMNNRLERQTLSPQPPAYTSSIDQANVNTKPLVTEFKKLKKRVVDLVNQVPHQEVNEEEASLFDVLWLLLASVIFVPLFMKIPGGSPVLGYLVAGVLIGPHTMHIIQNVHGTKAIAEFGVVFLLFNIGLELSVERLSSMKKYVFGLGTTQVFATVAGVGLFLNFVPKIGGPPAIIIASGLALSSTAVVLQVLQERGESTSRHGRATFSVLLFQDLAVVVLLILIPLLSSNGGVGLKEIGSALGVAGIKAVCAIVGIIASGRLFLRPIYKQMADNHNAEIFAANTLLVVLGTSVLTARAGLSMALGAFLAGLLLAETEFALQVESDIAPYRGLLLGLFFMTVGMSIDPKLLVAKFPEIAAALSLLIVGKTLLVAGVGRLFGLSPIAAIRAGLLLAPGGEFAFVAFGEAVNHGILSSQLSSLLFLVVGLSMALTPWLAAGGQLIAARFEQQDVRSLLPQENETDDLQGHIIICGFGRVGQIIAQLLSERLIPFVALDVRSDRVSVGRQLDLPVYFGDAGSKEVLHKVGADRAAAAVITLDTPGANYRTVWALSKHFPGIKTFVRAHDVDHGINLEKAGATAVVPETLEPSLQLAAAVLAQAKVPAYEIASAIDEFRSRHLSELTELSETSGTSLGYGFSRVMTKPLIEVMKMKADEEGGSDKQVEGTIVAVP